MKVLHVIPNFYPATKWGGPIFSTKAICDGIASVKGVELEVFTTDAAGPARGDKLSLPHRRVRTLIGYQISYFHRVLLKSVAPRMIFALPSAIWRADIVHITSCYSFPVLPALGIAKLLRRPVVWSPRGAIQATEEWGAAPRRGPKRVYEALARLVLPVDIALHVTAESEAAATAKRIPGVRMAVIPNCVEIPDETVVTDRCWRPNGRLRLGFLSRLHEKKGLENLLFAMVELPSEVELDIYGTGSNDYVDELAARCSALSLDERVRFHGHVEADEKSVAFRSIDIFVLPSYSENFGIVIAEALAHGVPVITTEATPWQALLENGCGEAVAVGVEPLVAAIRRMALSELAQMGRNGRAWMVKDFSANSTNGEMFTLYKELVSENKQRSRIA